MAGTTCSGLMEWNGGRRSSCSRGFVMERSLKVIRLFPQYWESKPEKQAPPQRQAQVGCATEVGAIQRQTCQSQTWWAPARCSMLKGPGGDPCESEKLSRYGAQAGGAGICRPHRFGAGRCGVGRRLFRLAN